MSAVRHPLKHRLSHSLAGIRHHGLWIESPVLSALGFDGLGHPLVSLKYDWERSEAGCSKPGRDARVGGRIPGTGSVIVKRSWK